MQLPHRMAWSVALAALLAGASLTPATASDGKLVIGAESVRDTTREYSDGRKEVFCRVVFKLTNNTGKPLTVPGSGSRQPMAK